MYQIISKKLRTIFTNYTREPVLLLVLLMVCLGSWLFIEIADRVMAKETHAFDKALLILLREKDNLAELLGPPWLEAIARDITALGGVSVLTLFVLAIAGFFVLLQKFRFLIFLLLSTGGGLLVSSLLKRFFNRPRPEVVPHLVQVYSASFPSGHSMMSAIVYLTVCSIIASYLNKNSTKIYVLTIAFILTLLIGISRVYLGVHYPTDVLAGWSAGLSWALFCWLITKRRPQHLDS